MQNDAGNLPALRLFIAGNSLRSQKTVKVLRSLCFEYLGSISNHLEIIDIFQQPEIARQEQVIATPTLIKYQPVPKRIFIGDLTKTDRLVASLGWSKT